MRDLLLFKNDELGMTTDPYRLWLSDSLNRLKPEGKTRSGLARHLGKEPSAVTKMLRAENPQSIPSDLLPKISSYLGIPLPGDTLGSRVVPNRAVFEGVLAVGAWYENGVEAEVNNMRHEVPTVPTLEFGEFQQYSRIVQTQTFRDILIGDYCVFLRYSDLRSSPRDGDFVHVRRTNGQTEENSLRRVVVNEGRVSLMVDVGAARDVALHPDNHCSIVGLSIALFRMRTL